MYVQVGLKDESGFQAFWSRKKHSPLHRKILARDENLSWTDLKLIRSKSSALLWTQVNLQLQPPMQDVSLLEKTQRGFKFRTRKNNTKANLRFRNLRNRVRRRRTSVEKGLGRNSCFCTLSAFAYKSHH